jgi:hypothetical protein
MAEQDKQQAFSTSIERDTILWGNWNVDCKILFKFITK